MRLHECTVRAPRSDKKGKLNIVSEIWITDALSFTEAEANAMKVTGATDVTAIRRTSYSELIMPDNADEKERWYKAKVNFINENEKKTPYLYLVRADSVDDAHQRVEEFLRDTVVDTEIDSIDATKIVGII